MTTSGTSTFNPTRDQIIKGALRLVGALSQGEEPTADQVTEASEALNMLVKAWESDSMPLWGLEEHTIDLVTGVNTYKIGTGQDIDIPKPLRILQAWNSNNNIDTPMRLLTKQEYNMLGNKITQGVPIQFYYDVQRDYGKLKLFPTPSAIAEDSYTVSFVYQRPFEDFDSATNTADFPQEWIEAIKYGLAVRLSAEYGLTVEQRRELRTDAKEIKDLALSNGTESGSIYFGVERRY